MLPKTYVRSPARLIDVDGGENDGASGEKRSRAKICVPLLKQEIEDDFVNMTGLVRWRRMQTVKGCKCLS